MNTDTELLAAYSTRGDRRALNELFGRHYPHVYHVVLRWVGHDSDARDVTQTVFLKALDAAPNYAGHGSFRRWLLRIAANEVRQHWRRSGRGTRGSGLVDVIVESAPEEEASRRELERALDGEVQELDPELRLPLVLYYHEQMSFAEVADVLQTSKSTAKARCERAVGRLRQRLKGRPLALSAFVRGLPASSTPAGTASAVAAVSGGLALMKFKLALVGVVVAATSLSLASRAHEEPSPELPTRASVASPPPVAAPANPAAPIGTVPFSPASPTPELVAAAQAAGHTVFRCRVLDPAGRPIAKTRVRFEVLAAPKFERLFRFHIVTDADGVAREKLDSPEKIPPGTHRVLVETRAQPEAKGTCHLQGPAPRGVLDLGDVRVRLSPLLVAGKVVDGLGRPVVGAEVQVSGRLWEHGRRVYMNCGGSTREGGRFIITGDFSGPIMSLHVRKKGFVCHRDFSCRRGKEDAVIVLPHGEGLRGRVVMPEGVSPKSVKVQSRPTGGEGWWGESVEEDGTFHYRGLDPGDIDLAVQLRNGDGTMLVLLERIARGPDGTSDDPRLDPIDLRGKLENVRVTVKDHTGRRLPRVAVAKLRQGSGKPQGRRFGNDGEVTIVVRKDVPRDVVVWADGYRPQRVTALAADREVTLEPGLAVDVQVLPAAVRDPSLRIAYRLRHTESKKRFPRTTTDATLLESAVAGPGRFQLRVPRPGRYELELFAVEVQGGKARLRSLHPKPRPEIEITGPGEVLVLDQPLAPR